MRDTVYFDGANTHRAMFVVALWAVGGLVLVLVAEALPGLLSRRKKVTVPEPTA